MSFQHSVLIIDSSESVQVSALVPGQTYEFKLLAMNNCAPSESSNIFPVTLGTRAPDSILEQLIGSDGLAVGETQLAPDQVYPLETSSSAAELGEVSEPPVGVTAGEVALPTPQGSVLASFFGFGGCRFSGFWRWLCWPWWLLLVILIAGLIWWWRKMRTR
jgi:hypothetical protein